MKGFQQDKNLIISSTEMRGERKSMWDCKEVERLEARGERGDIRTDCFNFGVKLEKKSSANRREGVERFLSKGCQKYQVSLSPCVNVDQRMM